MTLQDLIAQLPEVDDVVGRIGLQTRRSAVGSVAFGIPAAFALGAVAGVATALLTAPRAGAELRAELQRGFQETLRTLRESAGGITNRASTSEAAVTAATGVS